MSAPATAHEAPQPRAGGVAWAALGSAGLFVTLKLPVLGAFSALAPFPLILQRLKNGLGAALTSSLISTALVSLAFSPAYALVYLVALASPGVILGEAVARGRGIRRACVWAFVLLAFEIGVGLFVAGPRMAELLFFQPLEQLRSPQFLGEMRGSGLPPERVEDWAEQSRELQSVIQVVYPAAFIIMGALLVLANAWLLRTYLAKRDPGWLEGGEFEGIRWPLGLTVPFVAAGAAVMAASLRPLAYNVLLVLAFFFGLQGLAVVTYYVHRLAAAAFLRGVVLALVLVNPWAPQILALVGLFDLWFDLRQWAAPPPEEG